MGDTLTYDPICSECGGKADNWGGEDWNALCMECYLELLEKEEEDE